MTNRFKNKFYTSIFATNLDGLLRKGRINNRYHTIIEEVQEALEEIYPDNYDIILKFIPLIQGIHTNTYGYNFGRSIAIRKYICIRFDIIVRFPELTIRNSRNSTHDIKNLYTKTSVSIMDGDEDRFRARPFFEDIQGLRTTLTGYEIISAYGHSHLSYDLIPSGNGLLPYSRFCTGSGDINMLRSTLNASYDINTLKLYLLMIKTFVEWESLEGGPYRRIDKIYYNEIDPEEVTSSSLKSDFIISEFYRNKERYNTEVKIDFNYNYTKNGISIKEDERFINFVKTKFTYSIPTYTDGTGRFFKKHGEPNNIARVYNDKYIFFRNEKIYLERIDSQPPNILDRLEQVPHPKVVQAFKEHFEKLLYESQIKDYTIRRLRESTTI